MNSRVLFALLVGVSMLAMAPQLSAADWTDDATYMDQLWNLWEDDLGWHEYVGTMTQPPWCNGGWLGVTCDDDQRVIAIDVLLDDRSVHSTALANLEKLKRLNLRGIIGAFPALCNSGSELEQISIEGTISGTLGSTIFAQCKEVVSLELHLGSLYGTIPHISYMSKLKHLDLSNNAFDYLPSFTSNVELEYVSLASNDLYGGMPYLYYNKKLEVLLLDDNRLYGWVTGLGSYNSLRVVNLSHNNFYGYLPSFGDASNIEVFHATDNGLYGYTNNYKSWLDTLKLCDIDNNNFSDCPTTVLKGECSTSYNEENC